jgi:hypothetical protein
MKTIFIHKKLFRNDKMPLRTMKKDCYNEKNFLLLIVLEVK